MDNTATDLFNLLVSRDYTVKTLNSQGKPVVKPEDAEMFSFDFETKNNNYGTVVILLDDENNFECYYGDNVGKNIEGEDKDTWYDFLLQLKTFATRNLLSFNLKDLDKLKYSMQGMAAINEGLFEGWNGTKHTSYNNKPGTTRLKIVHSKAIEEGEQRFRNIEKLYVENAEGERFKLPFTSLVAGRAMARHVAEGGTPYDVFGLHIVETVREANVLAKFTQATRAITEEDGEQFDVVEAGRERYKTLRQRLKSLAGKRGYHAYKENWNPATIDEGVADMDKLHKMFTRETIDSRIEEAFPFLAAQLAEAGFANKLSPSGKVPVGLYTFVYSVVDPSRVQFIANSAEKRGMAVIAKGKNKLRIDGDAMQHSSLIYSLQQLGVEGEVKEKHTAQMDEGIYKKGKIAFKIAKGVLKYLPPVLIGTYLAVQDAEQQEKRDAEQKAGYAQQLQQPEQTKESTMKEFDKFASWADHVTEGTWAWPRNDDQSVNMDMIKELAEIFQSPIPAGEDAMHAASVLYNYIGDDELFDSLAEEAEENGPNADVRDVVLNFLNTTEGWEDIGEALSNELSSGNFNEAEDFGARGMNKYGMSAVKGPDGFYALVNGKVVAGPFDSLEELKAYQEEELNKDVNEQLDIDSGEEQRKVERDSMLEMNAWRKLAGMQEKVYEDFTAFQEPQQQVTENFSDTPLRDREDYLEKSKALYDLLRDPSLFDDEEAQQAIQQRILRLNDEAREMGLIEMSETEYASKLEQDILEDWGSSDGTVLVKGIDDAIEKHGLNPDVIRQAAESLAEFYGEDMGYGDDIEAATDAVLDTWARRSEIGKRLAKLFSEDLDEADAGKFGQQDDEIIDPDQIVPGDAGPDGGMADPEAANKKQMDEAPRSEQLPPGYSRVGPRGVLVGPSGNLSNWRDPNMDPDYWARDNMTKYDMDADNEWDEIENWLTSGSYKAGNDLRRSMMLKKYGLDQGVTPEKLAKARAKADAIKKASQDKEDKFYKDMEIARILGRDAGSTADLERNRAETEKELAGLRKNAGLATSIKATPLSKTGSKGSVNVGQGWSDQMDINDLDRVSAKYGTSPASDQTAALAHQEREFAPGSDEAWDQYVAKHGSKSKVPTTRKMGMDVMDLGLKGESKVSEAGKPDYLDLDKDGNKKEPMKQAAKDAEKKGDKELDERSLTKGEEKKREKYVKGMKKSKADFSKRYGKRGEEVMYATATKMAKESEGATNVFGKGIYESLTELEDDLDIALGNGITATSQLDKPKNSVGMIEPDDIIGVAGSLDAGEPEGVAGSLDAGEPGVEKNLGDKIADKGAELSATINKALSDIKRLAGMGN